MAEFLPKDPAAAIIEIKEKLYERMNACIEAEKVEFEKQIVKPSGDDYSVCNAFNAEIHFLSELLDLIERS